MVNAKPAKPPIAMAFSLRFLFLFDRETIGVAAGRFITGSAEMDFFLISVITVFDLM